MGDSFLSVNFHSFSRVWVLGPFYQIGIQYWKYAHLKIFYPYENQIQVTGDYLMEASPCQENMIRHVK